MNTAIKLASVSRLAESTPLVATSGHIVAAIDEQRFEVATPEARAVVTRAPSCLLVPREGDEVWLVPSAGGELVIAAVVTAASRDVRTLAMPGDDSEIVARGALRVKSGATLQLDAQQDVKVRGRAFDVATLRTTIASESVELLATRVEAGFDAARLVARKIDASLDSLAMRLERSLRWVSQLDQVRAGHLDYRAKGNARIHGGVTVVSAERVAQVRGEEVHLS